MFPVEAGTKFAYQGWKLTGIQQGISVTADNRLDTSGLTCPIPILKAKKALTAMAPGSVLEVLATDPAAPKDFIAFCKATGHELLGTTEKAGTWQFLIRRN